MRFFTPSLYMSYNSSDAAQADSADELWEHAVQAYQQHWNEIAQGLSARIRRLRELCLHDAEFLSWPSETTVKSAWATQPFWSRVSVISLRHHHEIVTLTYFLRDDIQVRSAPADWRFSGMPLHWLYDEVDVTQTPVPLYWHRILVSDGRVLEIPMTDVVVFRAPFDSPGLAAEQELTHA